MVRSGEAVAMYAYKDIRRVHIEMTDKCNAACPQCSRNDHGGAVNPLLPLIDLSLDDIRSIFPDDFVAQLNQVYLCGNYGDPVMARDTLATLAHFRRVNPELMLGMHTNGSARGPDWWAELGGVMGKKKGYVRFSIDGLEDTNHVYRRNTKWHVIMRSVESYIAAGGRAEWDYLVFRHNEHQVQAARELAVAMGFSLFTAKATSRFVDGMGLKQIDSTPVKNDAGGVEYYLERPLAPEWNNDGLVRIRSLTEHYGSAQSYLGSTPITCKATKDSGIYVSAEGHVYPCCWLAGRRYNPSTQPESFAIMLQATGGLSAIDAKQRPLRDILDGALFQEAIPASWGKKSVADGRISTCAWVCGEADPSAAQWRNKQALEKTPAA